MADPQLRAATGFRRAENPPRSGRTIGRARLFDGARCSRGRRSPRHAQEQENQVEREPERDCRSYVVEHRREGGTLYGRFPSRDGYRRLDDKRDHGVDRPGEHDVERYHSSQKDEHEAPIARRRSTVSVSPQTGPFRCFPEVGSYPDPRPSGPSATKSLRLPFRRLAVAGSRTLKTRRPCLADVSRSEPQDGRRSSR